MICSEWRIRAGADLERHEKLSNELIELECPSSGCRFTMTYPKEMKDLVKYCCMCGTKYN